MFVIDILVIPFKLIIYTCGRGQRYSKIGGYKKDDVNKKRWRKKKTALTKKATQLSGFFKLDLDRLDLT